MKVLLDECVDRRLVREIPGHDVKTVPQMGWAGIKKWRPPHLGRKEIRSVCTVDRNLSFQQSLTNYNIAVIVLRARANRLHDLRPLVPELLNALSSAKLRDVVGIGG